jgi:CO/xanthine dehydrogenase Mo-binding subunit
MWTFYFLALNPEVANNDKKLIFQATVGEAVTFAQNAYSAAAWNIVPHAVVTDTPPNTFTRAPGTTQV